MPIATARAMPAIAVMTAIPTTMALGICLITVQRLPIQTKQTTTMTILATFAIPMTITTPCWIARTIAR